MYSHEVRCFMDFHPNIVLKHDIFPQKEMFFTESVDFCIVPVAYPAAGTNKTTGASLTK